MYCLVLSVFIGHVFDVWCYDIYFVQIPFMLHQSILGEEVSFFSSDFFMSSIGIGIKANVVTILFSSTYSGHFVNEKQIELL